MIVESSNIKDVANQLNRLMSSIPTQLERINKEIDLCERETQDLLHMIELTNFHASAGYKLANEIKITRRKRRGLKDELNSLLAVQLATRKHRPVLGQTQAITTAINQEISKQSNRKYTPRVRSDFSEAFSKL